MRRLRRQKPSRLHPLDVVLQRSRMGTSVVLHTACDAEWALLAFHEQLQRLAEQRIGGDLLLVHHAEEPRTLLRQPLR